MDSIPPRVSNLLRGAALNVIWLLHSTVVYCSNGIVHSLFQNLFGNGRCSALATPFSKSCWPASANLWANLIICQGCSASRSLPAMPSEQTINALFCQGVCSHSIHQMIRVMRWTSWAAGAPCTTEKTRKWGCTSLFVSYLRLVCFHRKARRFVLWRRRPILKLDWKIRDGN
jgi:hypothetical protein